MTCSGTACPPWATPAATRATASPGVARLFRKYYSTWTRIFQRTQNCLNLSGECIHFSEDAGQIRHIRDVINQNMFGPVTHAGCTASLVC